MATHRETLTHLFRREHGSNGNARSQTLGERHDVWDNAALLVREQRAQTAHPGLYFVQHQQQAVLITDFTDTLQVWPRGLDDTAFALERLEQHRNGARRHGSFERLGV